MRLLNIRTLKPEYFLGEIPPYAILSHTWGHGEVTLQDLNLDPDELGKKPGWAKIVGFCRTVQSFWPRPLEYVWVDTCCIDKTSSAELSESINSMFRWYQLSQCCFAFLEDVGHTGAGPVGPDFEKSRWFTRGWTLQELIAPLSVTFFDGKWKCIGDKTQLAPRISQQTGIDEKVILAGDFSNASVAERMSWAAARKTTRQEDIAYCLLGIFDLNLNMLYGEGEKAFIRLQEEILREYDDHSIFAWDSSTIPESVSKIGVLAPHPSFFKSDVKYEAHPSSGEPPVITNRGIRIDIPLVTLQGGSGEMIGTLSCFAQKDVASVVGVGLVKNSTSGEVYSRTRGKPMHLTMRPHIFRPKQIYLANRSKSSTFEGAATTCWVEYGPREDIEPYKTYPPTTWHHSSLTGTMTMTLTAGSPGSVSTLIVFEAKKLARFCGLLIKMKPRERTSRFGLVDLGQPLEFDQKLKGVLDTMESEEMNAAGRVEIEGTAFVAKQVVELIRGSWMYKLSIRAGPG